jgi:putative addiction module killer protein
MNEPFRVVEYVEGGRSPFAEWFNDLDPVTAARVDRYVRRLEGGNFGAAKALRGGVYELRMDFGPGYRVYFGRDGRTHIILLGGGDKRRQSADIAAALARWERYLKSPERKQSGE